VHAGFHPTAVFGALGAACGRGLGDAGHNTQWFNALGTPAAWPRIIEYLAAARGQTHAPGWAARRPSRRAHGAGGFHRSATPFDGEHGFFTLSPIATDVISVPC
jgi:hypothetical protein